MERDRILIRLMVACQFLEDSCADISRDKTEDLDEQEQEKLIQQLTKECGDVQAYIGLLVENKIISATKLAIAELKELSDG